MAERLRKKVFPEFRIGLVHGRLKAEEREEVMQAFRAREADLLVATTVVEVGVDIPTAAVMVVENAERFGLSQLHQLRGRVGRGGGESWCILMRGAEPTPEAEARLRALEQTTDGFAISERDLEIRGPGEFFGTRQSGLPEMRIANVLRDRAVLEEAREEAFRLVERGPLPPGLEGFLRDYWGERFGLIEVG
jgi:ATP-dependent DNA helicase RecG